MFHTSMPLVKVSFINYKKVEDSVRLALMQCEMTLWGVGFNIVINNKRTEL